MIQKTEEQVKSDALATMQEYFPNGGLDWDNVSALFDAIRDGKVAGLNVTASIAESSIEQAIQAAGKTAPRITTAHIDSVIASEHYFTAENGVHGAYRENNDVHVGSLPSHGSEVLGLLTICVLVLKNGFTVTGESACASPENFDAEIGRKIARNNAFDKVWGLEGYLLKQRLFEEEAESDFDKQIHHESVARIAHEVNRSYCQSIGDDSQPSWEDAPAWQRDSAINGVAFHLKNEASPEESHANWLTQKENEGWKYGPVKDVYKLEHPCFMPYDQLPQEQRVKDYLFRAVVNSFK